MTPCFICPDCSKTFKSERAVRGHSRVHKGKAYTPYKFDRSICCIHTKRKVHVSRWQAYLDRLRVCQNLKCAKTFETGTDRTGNFCCRSCARVVTNKDRAPRSADQREKTRQSLIAYHASEEGRMQIANRRNQAIMSQNINEKKSSRSSCTIIHKTCPACEKGFFVRPTNKNKIHCSERCENEMHSRRMSAKMLDVGTTNFSTRVPEFTYKDIVIDCDSKLEAAGVMYLVDIMGAGSIERCRSILSYRDNHGGLHRFNPDFYVRIGDARWVVEVKQVRKQSAKVNNYHRYFDEKKEALSDFGVSRGINTLWLDFDHDPRFRTIYRKFIGEK